MAECGHDHGAGPCKGGNGPESRLRLAIPLTLAVFLAEMAGGLWSGSLALVSDSLHVLFDATALVLSYVAIRLAARPATDRHSYGLHRSEILAALVNGLALIAVSGWIFHEAWDRLRHPQEVRVGGMLAVAAAGLVANAVVARLLHGHHHDDLNVRGAYLHVIGDLAASVGVIIAGGIIWATGWTLADPILGFGIGALLFWGAGRLVADSLHILMEGVPRGLTVEGVAAAVRTVPGVADFHRVHIWSLCSHIRALSAHLTVDPGPGRSPQEVLGATEALLDERFHITHTTIQTECSGCGADALFCNLAHPEEHHLHEPGPR